MLIFYAKLPTTSCDLVRNMLFKISLRYAAFSLTYLTLKFDLLLGFSNNRN